MRLFFRLLYHSFSWSYDLVAAAVSAGRWRSWVLEAAKLIQGPRVLELGYGPGHLQEHLAGAGWEVFGLDESMQMARQAARRLSSGNFSHHLARGIAQRLPFPTHSFDTIVATFPTPYIIEPDTLAEILRVLKPGGRLVVLIASWITGKSPLERILHTIFRVTGQAPDEHLELSGVIEPYQEAGFQARLRFVNLPGSRLMFILAGKSR